MASDIDLKKGILELVDNAIDEWKLRGKPTLKVDLELNVEKKELTYEDNAGGIKEGNLNLLMQPGGTTRTPTENTIGEFGLGMKRGIVALAREAEVTSRFENEGTFKIKVDEAWITSTSWKIPKYRSSEILPGRTNIHVTKVKFDVNLDVIADVKRALSETYGLILSDQTFTIWLNGELVEPITFENWAYPLEGRHPRDYKFFISTGGRRVYVNATVGLMIASRQTGEYGFYIYCNDRLILKDYKDPEIGFTRKLLGYPHAAHAWFRGILRISGSNQDMPWNSTKSGLDFSNAIISRLKDDLLKLCTPYIQLSRRLIGDSQAQIATHPQGTVETVDLTSRQDFVLKPEQMPSIPPKSRSEAERLLNLNKDRIRQQPWTRALVENVYAADLILGKKLENKNRFALLLLDSCLEIAFRDYLIRIKNVSVTKEQLSNRKTLVAMMKKNAPAFEEDIWKSLDFYYDLRCALYHELASPEPTYTDIEHFRELVSTMLFGLHQLTV